MYLTRNLKGLSLCSALVTMSLNSSNKIRGCTKLPNIYNLSQLSYPLTFEDLRLIITRM